VGLIWQEGVIFGAAECLRALTRSCVDGRLVQRAVQRLARLQQDGDDVSEGREGGAGPPTPLESIAVAVESTLGFRYKQVCACVCVHVHVCVDAIQHYILCECVC